MDQGSLDHEAERWFSFFELMMTVMRSNSSGHSDFVAARSVDTVSGHEPVHFSVVSFDDQL